MGCIVTTVVMETDNTKEIDMTKAQVREILPNVSIQLGKKVYRASISGRRNAFATVSVKDDQGFFLQYEFSWEAITRSVNSMQPLHV